MDLTENFLKLLEIALIVVGVLAMFFSFVSYNINIQDNSAEKNAIVIGNFLLSSDCLTYSGTKSLFSEEKLDNMKTNPSCLQMQYLFGVADVKLQDLSKSWPIEISSPSIGKMVDFSVVVRMNSGESKPATMVVRI